MVAMEPLLASVPQRQAAKFVPIRASAWSAARPDPPTGPWVENEPNIQKREEPQYLIERGKYRALGGSGPTTLFRNRQLYVGGQTLARQGALGHGQKG
jgi:hypothetical protein